jgi:hypothetical protein
MRKETDTRQREANREIRRQLASRSILLGRTLIVVAEKLAAHSMPTIHASQL